MSHMIPACRRCGTCCVKGGPALHEADLVLLNDKVLGKEDLYTLRVGEPVHDQILDRVVLLEAECIKVSSMERGTTCRFYSTASGSSSLGRCAIHPAKPQECLALKCWDTADLAATSTRPRIERFDLVAKDSALGELIRIHEQRCAVPTLLELLRSDHADASEEIHRAAAFDAALRSLIPERSGAAPELLPFLLGRPLDQVIRGLQRWLGLKHR
ncbi:YkgJ family cysteine cluster protein [Desulfonatronum parangueonense]